MIKIVLVLISLQLSAQTLTLQTAVRELNSSALTVDRLGFWTDTLTSRGPKSWGVTPAEYASIIISLPPRFAEIREVRNSVPILLRGIRQLETEAGTSSAELLPLLDELARTYAESDNASEAIAIEARALKIAEASFGSNHPSLLTRIRRFEQGLVRLADPSRDEQIADLRRRAAELEVERDRQLAQLTSMGQTPTPALTQNQNAELVNVYYATNRGHGDGRSPATFFGTRRDSTNENLSYGQVTVSVPREFEVVGLREGRYWVGEIRKGDYRKAALVDVKPFESEATFTRAVRDRIKSTARRELLVFIHGYSTDWHTAVQRTAALSVALELDGAPVLFSWPSRGDFLSYAADGNELTSAAVIQLAKLLSTLTQTGEADRIYLVSHSMGARFLLSALENILSRPTVPTIDNLVFASPDVDAQDFARRLPAVSKLAKRTSVYVSDNDLALRLSTWVNDSSRAGDPKRKLLFNGVDTIDTTKSKRDPWNIDGLIGHNDFATGAMDDLRALIWHGMTASQRCILVPVPVPNGKIWALHPPQGCTPDTFKMGIHAVRRLGPSDAAAFLSIQEKETCRISPSGLDCRAWRDSKRVADAISALGQR